MQNEQRRRIFPPWFLPFLAVAALHVFLLFFMVFNVNTTSQEAEENARVMKVTDLAEAPPPPPPKEEIPQVESIAETMIETDTEPVQTVVAPGTITTASSWDDYLPIHKVSVPPKFDEKAILAGILYPPIAQRSGIEGMVYLEIFVDRNGLIQRITILKEDPPNRGFGEAAIRAFTGKRGEPAMANGEPVSSHYRYPVNFRIK